ncbi:mechanosensitive ion channel family protein [Thiocapsa bogorovii]|uniref:mechanosensitive ion channel family protein n=1 Tax=Thiocapsa bogorovii TaxID=521689 RepID=UPI001E409F79|nr:mechanosensitive ion channel domain-containing protein [Thiocapsa bogorovii]UHD16570.1 mechanosensitive ion channel family protein [Thiocapsa bogorovii]
MQNDSDIIRLFNVLDTAALVELGLILLGAAVLIIVNQTLVPWIANRLHGRYRLYLLAMVPVMRLIIIVVAFVLIVPVIIDPSLQNMVAVLGTLGLAVGFALKDYVSSLIAGVVAVIEMPYRLGDWIEINGAYGEVTKVGMRTVQIVTPEDTRVSIPHLKLWNDSIFNANNGGPELQCVADFYLHPSHDAGAVMQALQDVALTSPYLQLDQPVAVVVCERPWGTHYRLKAYPIDPRQQFRFVSDLTVRGKAILGQLGVQPSAVASVARESAQTNRGGR